MNLIDIFLYFTEGVFLLFAIMFAYYSLQRAKLIKGSRGHQIMAVGALLLIIISILASVDIFFFPSSRLGLTVFSAWTGALFVLVYGGLLIGKSIQGAYGNSWLKMTRWYPGSINNLIGISLLVFGGIPVYLLDILRSTSGQFSWYWASRIGIWAFCFANLAFAAKIQCFSGLGRKKQEEEAILLRDDVLIAKAYGTLVNNFLAAVRPFAGAVGMSIREYFEHNPALFEGCKTREDATVDFEPVERNLKRIHREHRIQDICRIFSVLTSEIIQLYGVLTSPKHAEQVLAKSYGVTREAFRDSPVFFDILRSLPKSVLKKERIALLPREELEARVRERTRELHQARAELQEAKDYTDNVIKSMADALIVVNQDATIRAVNQATLDLLGYEENELVGKPIGIVLGEEDKLSYGESVLDALVKKEIVNVEGTYRSKDGRKIPMLFSGSIMRDNNSKIQGIIYVARDVTEPKRIQEALQKSEERYRAIFGQAADSIVLIDAETGALVEFNDRAHENLGYTRQEFEKLTLPNFEVVESAQEVERHMKTIIKKGTDTFETKHRTKSGEIRNIRVSSRAVSIGGRNFIQSLWFDITEQKKAEQKIKAYQKRLRSLASQLTIAEEEERRRIATELHDAIGQLLALCKIKLGELGKVAASSDARPLVEEIKGLLEEIIQYSRSLTLQLGPPIVYELGLEVALEWLAESVHEQQDIRINLEVDSQTKPIDEELRIFLFRAAQELLMNVTKHAKTDKAKVSLGRENENIYLSVEDRGVGFNSDILDTPSGKDRGFGLFSMRERIKYFGGEFSLQSKPGQGTRVSLMVPVKPLRKRPQGRQDEQSKMV